MNALLIRSLRPVLFTAALLLAFFNNMVAAAEMPLANWVQAAGLRNNQVGVAIVDLASNTPLYLSNGDEPLNPASTMKLLTTYAALSVLGPEYRWHTSFYLGGALRGDVLAGDLIIKGGGDPKLVIEDMQALVQQLRQAGLRDIQGDVLIDNSLYDIGDQSVESFDGDPTQPYNVRPNAAMMNFKATNFIVTPGEAGVTVRMDPDLADVRMDVNVRQVAGPCRYGAAGLSIHDDGNPAAARVQVSGTYSGSCGEQGTYVAVLTHQQFIHGFFKAAWLAAGGSFGGQTRFVKGLGLKDRKPWFVWESPRTLGEVVHDINKFSNNVMARQLLLQTAADVTKLPATPERARNTLLSWLRRRKLNFNELVIDNGAGLSRVARISAAHLAQVLRDASQSSIAALLRDSLPLVGVDGTMKSRLVHDALVGNASIKTGSLTGVRAIAGYVKAASGRDLALVVLINGPRAEASQGLQDQILKWAYQQY